MSSLEIKNLSFAYKNNNPILENFSLEIKTNDFVGILGPSGCGKSTLLKLVADLLKPNSGSITREIAKVSTKTIIGEEKSNHLGFIFQDSNLLPWRTVQENLSLVEELLDLPPKNKSQILEQVKLTGVEKLYPYQLSGGMKMRVALARALISDPKYILFDEPFSALDEITRSHIQLDVRKLFEKGNKTFLFVTHSITEALFLAERIILLGPKGQILKDEKSPFPFERNLDLRYQKEFTEQVKKWTQSFEGIKF